MALMRAADAEHRMPTFCKICKIQLVTKGPTAMSEFNQKQGPGAGGAIDVGRGGNWGGAQQSFNTSSTTGAAVAGQCNGDM